jgi:hypothetical protein
MNASVYVPAVATSYGDLKIGYSFLKDFEAKGYTIGLMLLIFGGKASLEGEQKDKQYENFENLTTKFGNIPVIVMVSNRPLEDLDFFHNPGGSIDHIRAAVDFAKGLPGALNRVVTFHLNSLLKPEEWVEAGTNDNERYEFFIRRFGEVVFPALKEVFDYASLHGIELKIETCPVPEFGDCSDNDVENGINLNQLGNPYPLFSGRGFQEIRKCGLGIVLDLCHTHTLYKAAQEKSGRKDFHSMFKGISPKDLEILKKGNLENEVSELISGDVVHLNDSRGLFVRGESVHEEGVVLGDGEISELDILIPELFNKNLKIVFELNETDFEKRPNLKKSIDYVLERI